MNWGLSEVAVIKVEDDSLSLARYRDFPVPFHHVTCWWEGDRRIDVVFTELEILSE